MSWRKTGRRQSYPSSNNLMTEIKSWNQNKREDRKLAMKQTMVNKDMKMRRRVHDLEVLEMSRNMEENIKRTTPSTEEYLDRSQKRYHVWREREQDRLERRYRDLYKDYLHEFSQLALQQRNLAMSMNETNSAKPKKGIHTSKSQPNLQTPYMTTDTENTSPEPKLPKGKNSNKEGTRKTDPENGIKPKAIPRRASTGSIPTSRGSISRRNSSITYLPTLTEAKSDTEKATGDDNTDEIDDNGENVPVYTDDVDANDGQNNTTSAGDKSVRDEYNNKTVDATVPKKTKRRRSLGNTRKGSIDAPIRGRLDRRPTMPHFAIPFNCGN